MFGTTWAVAVVTAGLLAAPTSPSPSPAPGGAAADLRADAAQDCKLITDLGPVITDLLGIVNGGATTPGSVAWLSAQATRARAAGRSNLATWLSERATLRQEQGAELGTRQQLLANGVSWCTAHGFGSAS